VSLVAKISGHKVHEDVHKEHKELFTEKFDII